jgi:hypothetical protein
MQFKVFGRTLNRLRDDGSYVVTLHADEEMFDDGLTIFDIENAILTAQIEERQRTGISAHLEISRTRVRVIHDRREVMRESGCGWIGDHNGLPDMNKKNHNGCANCGFGGLHTRRISRYYGRGKIF